MNQTEAEDVKHLAKPCNDVLEKLGRKWKPEVNQTVLYGKELMFIVSVRETRMTLLPFDIPDLGESLDDYVCTPEIIDVIPILEWQEIERVLEGVGYWLQIGRPHAGGLAKTQCMINKGDEANSRVCVRGKSRQEAVMRAVIKLGEEIKHV